MGVNLPAWCEPLIGVPYVKGGRDLSGADCIGFVSYILRERYGHHQLADYDGPLWEKGADVGAIKAAAEAFAARFVEVPAGEEREGDAVLLRMRGAPMHIGLVVRPGVMLHIEEGVSSCGENYRQRVWEKRITGFYRAQEREA